MHYFASLRYCHALCKIIFMKEIYKNLFLLKNKNKFNFNKAFNLSFKLLKCLIKLKIFQIKIFNERYMGHFN